MLELLSDYHPRNIIAVHLNRFDGTVETADMKALVDSYRFEEIIIPDLNDVLHI